MTDLLAPDLRPSTRPAAARAGMPPLLPWIAVLVAITAVLVVQAANLLSAPYFEDDEGTYVAQALAVLHGRLAPYTYFYDHPPAGWVQMAGWFAITGGSGSLGDALASGRLFMLLVQAVSSVLVVIIVRRITGSLWAGAVAVLLFGLSPYALFYHRRVILDNLAAVWLLASIALLAKRRVTLTTVWASALALGIAVLSKEIAITFFPAIAVLAARRTPRESRGFALVGWAVIAGAAVSFYPLMALLKGELFVRGSVLGGTNPHVSLLCSLQWQSSRGTDGGLLQSSSGFWTAARQWAAGDPVLVVGGTIALLIAVTVLRRRPLVSMIGWGVLTFWLFLGRGGITLGLYLVPLIPFLAILLVSVAWLSARAAHVRGVPGGRRVAAASLGAASLVAVAASVCGLASSSNTQLFTTAPTAGQSAAAAWIERNLPADSRMIVDMYLWPALHEPAQAGATSFPSAEYYWKAAEDPAVAKRVFDDRWQNVDYVVVTPQLLADTSGQGFPIVRAALDHSVSVATFDTGYRVDIRRVDPAISSAFAWKQVAPPVTPPCMR